MRRSTNNATTTTASRHQAARATNLPHDYGKTAYGRLENPPMAVFLNTTLMRKKEKEEEKETAANATLITPTTLPPL